MLGSLKNLTLVRCPEGMPWQLVGRSVPQPTAPSATPHSHAQSPIATNVVVSAS